MLHNSRNIFILLTHSYKLDVIRDELQQCQNFYFNNRLASSEDLSLLQESSHAPLLSAQT